MEDVASGSAALVEVRAYARALMTEVVRPLEVINNLVYLALHDSEDAAKLNLYMQMAQNQLVLLNEITLSTLRFCDEQAKK